MLRGEGTTTCGPRGNGLSGDQPLIRSVFRGHEQEGVPARATLVVGVAEVEGLTLTLTPRTHHVRLLVGQMSPLSPVRRPKLDLAALLEDAAHNPTKGPVVDNAALDAVKVVAETGDLVSPQEQAARLLRRPIGGDVLVAPAALNLAVSSQLHAAIVAQTAEDSQ